MRADRTGLWLLLLAGLACAPPEAAGRREPFDAQGHRGARGLMPENTLPAFARALELGVSTLELDVGVTRDRAVVVAHDPYVPAERCLAPDGRRIQAPRGPLLRDLALEELRGYDCGSLPPDPRRFPSPPWQPAPGTPMPTLDEVFALAARDPDVRFNVETKLQPGDPETLPAQEFVAAVLAVVEARGLAARVSIQSFDWRALALCERLAPAVATVALLAPDTLAPEWLNGRAPGGPGGLAGLLRDAVPGADAVSPHWRMLLPPPGRRPLSLPRLQAAGYPVIPWTVNDAPSMRALIRLGVDGLISDYPDRLLAVLRSEGVPVR